MGFNLTRTFHYIENELEIFIQKNTSPQMTLGLNSFRTGDAMKKCKSSKNRDTFSTNTTSKIKAKKKY